jgi:O-antigen ligase
VALAVVFTGVLFTPHYYWYRITSISQVFSTMNMDWSLAMRFKATKVGWQLFLDHPFTGIGLNNFIVRSASELIVRMGAHNTYIEILTGVGIFGFIAYIMMPVAGIRGFLRGIRAPWSPENRWMSDLSYYFLISLIAVLMGAFFQMVQFYRLFWVPVICGVIAGRMAVEARLAARDQSV